MYGKKNPRPADSPLNGLDNVILTPHTAGLTYEAQEKVVEAIAEDVDRVLSGQPALRFVNFALPKKRKRTRMNTEKTDKYKNQICVYLRKSAS